MVVGKAPEVAPTAATVANLTGLQQNDVLQGRDLFREAFEQRYETDKQNNEYWTKHLDRNYGRTAAGKTRWFNKKYAELPSPTRRAWERESHRRWPRSSHAGQISALDVYANADEIYYTRRDGMARRASSGKLERGRWSVSEAAIINEYYNDFEKLVPGFQMYFFHAARAINHARKERYTGPAYLMSANAWPSGVRPTLAEAAEFEANINSMPPTHRTPGSVWRYAGKCGSGSYGACMVYRQVDAHDRTLRTIVLKKDIGLEGWLSNDRERAMLRTVQQHPRRSQYIVSFIDGTDSSGKALGMTWLDYAPFGSLAGLIETYYMNQATIPEPFLWYLFHCIAETILFMESGVTDPNQPDDPAWVQAGCPMIQTDLKPGNVLLDIPAPAQSWTRIYPKPLLADFGGVVPLTQAHIVRGVGGTWGFAPFEMMKPEDQRTANDHRKQGPLRSTVPTRGEPFAAPIPELSPIRSSAPVHQLGATIYNLMTLDAPQQLGDAGDPGLTVPPYWSRQARHMARHPWPWRGASTLASRDWAVQIDRGRANEHRMVGLPDGKRLKVIPKELDGRGRAKGEWWEVGGERVWYPYMPARALRPAYSDRLIELADRCMSLNIEDRPTPRQLMRETQAAMDDIARQFPTPAPAGVPLSKQTPQALILPDDKFPIGGAVLNDFT